MRDLLNNALSPDAREQIILATALYVAENVSNCECGSDQCGTKTAQAVLAAVRVLVDGFSESTEPPSCTAPGRSE